MKLALLGQTMLGGTAGRWLAAAGPSALLADEVVSVVHEADLVVLNLACAISERGVPRSEANGTPLFRAPPAAVEVLRYLRVDCASLISPHILDFATEALVDTFGHLHAAGVSWVGAGPDEQAARAPVVLQRAGVDVAIMAITDRPNDAAGPQHPGLAFADLENGAPHWLLRDIDKIRSDVTLLLSWWGPSFVTTPVPHVRRAADAFRAAGAGLVAGCSAHSVHGAGGGVLYGLGDFLRVDHVDPEALNELGLLFLITVEADRPTRLEAIPLALEDSRTRLADRTEAAWVTRHFRAARAAFGTELEQRHGRLLAVWHADREPRASRG